MVRNNIPIRDVIEHLLKVPSKIANGTFRFRCPLCDRYNTAVNAPVNLARCFDCEKNFNPIDMAMLVGKMNFVEAVNLLINYKGASTGKGKTASCSQRSLSDAHWQMSGTKPVAMANLLTRLIDTNQKDNPQAQDAKPNPPSSDDIAHLENIADALSQLIRQLKEHHQNPA